MKTFRCLFSIIFCCILLAFTTHAIAQNGTDDNHTIASISYTGSWPDKCKVVINWTTDNEPNCTGFNLYRNTTPHNGSLYKVNRDGIIPAYGSAAIGGSYTFTDKGLMPNTTYYYTVEAIGSGGASVTSAPLEVKTKRLLARGGAPAGSYPALPEAIDALQSDNAVAVQKVTVPEWRGDGYYAFAPKNAVPTKGVIFYPGGKVKPESYAPLLQSIAAQGYLCVLIQMPSDLAIFGYDRAKKVIEDHGDITSWAIGGHSLGGVMSCRYTKDFGGIDGVVLLAAYPSSSFSIAESDVKVVSIYGTRDGLVTSDEIQDSVADLPAGTQFVPIVGGNHTQMGWYDTTPYPVQYGDNPAVISREEQQEEILTAVRVFLEAL
ncbi:MAG: hypothetical protein N3B18_12810 [Desulfobacterota bacterium]|nr:hypothetical protein [Thermodesulfobacteriota bacterium]